jgi:hypothetical protein
VSEIIRKIRSSRIRKMVGGREGAGRRQARDTKCIHNFSLETLNEKFI